MKIKNAEVGMKIEEKQTGEESIIQAVFTKVVTGKKPRCHTVRVVDPYGIARHLTKRRLKYYRKVKTENPAKEQVTR